MTSGSNADFFRSFQPASHEWIDPDSPDPDESDEVPDLSDDWYTEEIPLLGDPSPAAPVTATASSQGLVRATVTDGALTALQIEPALFDGVQTKAVEVIRATINEAYRNYGAALLATPTGSLDLGELGDSLRGVSEHAQDLMQAASTAQADVAEQLAGMGVAYPTPSQELPELGKYWHTADDPQPTQPNPTLATGASDAPPEQRPSGLSGPIAPFADAVGLPQTSNPVRELITQIGEPPQITEYPEEFYFSFPKSGIELYFERGRYLSCYLYTQPEPASSDEAAAMTPVASAPIDGLPALASEQEIHARFGEPTEAGVLLGRNWLRYQIGERSLSFRLDDDGRTTCVAVTYLVPSTDIHGNPLSDKADQEQGL